MFFSLVCEVALRRAGSEFVILLALSTGPVIELHSCAHQLRAAAHTGGFTDTFSCDFFFLKLCRKRVDRKAAA